MSTKDCLTRQLTGARRMTERLLADFHTPEQWTKQVATQCNHALWFVGHMAHTDNFMISILDPAQSKKADGFAERFGTGSIPTPNPADYPPSDEVVSVMRERREKLLSILKTLSEEDLAKPTPKGTPEFIPDYASIFETVVWHEGLHSGQLTVLRKVLGLPPVMATS
jgi:uncharacterized damage-inducible protein DinB